VSVSLFLLRDQQQVSILRFNNFLSSKLHVQVWHVAGAYCGAELLNNLQAAGNDLEQLHQNLIASQHLSTLDLLAPSLPAIKKKLTPNMLPDEPVRFFHSLCSPRGHGCFPSNPVFTLCADHAATDASERASAVGARSPVRRSSIAGKVRARSPAALWLFSLIKQELNN
jgi:hypothetical protein